MYGLWTGSQSEYHPADGALWIGGYDTARVDGPFTTFPSANGDDCYSCAQITNLTYINTNHSTSLLTSSLGLNVGLEPYVGTLEMPADIYANFVNATGGISFNNRTWLSSSADLGNLSVTFSNGYQTVIPWWELFLNPQDYDDDGTLEIQNSSLVVSTVSNYTDPDGYFGFWGLPILAGNYMIMDYDSQSFSLAKARQGQYTSSNGYLVTPLCKGIAPITTTPPVPGPTPPPTSNSTSAPVAKQSHTNVGAIAGGVVGGVIGVAIIVILAFFLFRSRRREKQYQQEQGSVTGSTTLAPGSQADRTSKVSPLNQQSVPQTCMNTLTNLFIRFLQARPQRSPRLITGTSTSGYIRRITSTQSYVYLPVWNLRICTPSSATTLLVNTKIDLVLTQTTRNKLRHQR